MVYASFFSGFSGNSLPKRPMTRLMIHKVRIVPPIPQISIVIPNVKLSMHDTSILDRLLSRRRYAKIILL
jgi:hypothetical protein